MADISVAPASANFSHGIQSFPVFSPCPSLVGMDFPSTSNCTDLISDRKLDRLLGNSEASCSTNSSSSKDDAIVDFSLTDVSKKLKGISVSDGRKGVLRGKLKSSSAKKVSFAENLTPFAANLKRSVTIGGGEVLFSNFLADEVASRGIQEDDNYPNNHRSTDAELDAESADVAPMAASGVKNFDDVWASLQACEGGALLESDADVEDDEKLEEELYGKNINLSRAASDMLWQLRRFEVLGASHGTPKAADGQENKLQKKVSF